MMSRENCYAEKSPQKLYKIGMFAQMNRVTIKALRHYDDIGLFKPEYVDEMNGYRYYTSDQLPQLHSILALRELGFSLEDIKKVSNGVSEKDLLIRKKCELLHEMADIQKQIARVEGYLSGNCLNSDYRIVMKSIPEVIIASMQVHMDGYEDLFNYMPAMGNEMEKAGCECAIPEYCFTIYYDEEYRESDIHAEICEAVTEKKDDTELIQFKVLPAVDLAACVLHKGPYYTLPKAYEAIVQYIEESGYEIIGYQRESYIDGIWNKDTEDEWLTEIQFPVRKIEKSY